MEILDGKKQFVWVQLQVQGTENPRNKKKKKKQSVQAIFSR